jgi:outer membrane protein TolC
MLVSSFALSLLAFLPLLAEDHVLTLKQAVEIAKKQNPDLVLARLDEQKAQLSVKVAKDPFVPKVFAGSGLAYTNGIPQSIDGAAPSVVQARAVMSIYNRPQSYRVAQAHQMERAATEDTAMRQEEAVFRTVLLFLDAEQLNRAATLQREQLPALETIRSLIQTRVAEGRDLPLESRKAELAVAKTKQRLLTLETDVERVESALAQVLGLGPQDRVRPAPEDPARLPETPNRDQATQDALRQSKELKLLESRMLARSLEAKSYLAERLPKLDLVAQYSLLARFNNFAQFFQRFQTHNGQLGVSVTVPLLVGPGARAYATQAEVEVARIRTQIAQTRNRIATSVRDAYQDLAKGEAAFEVAKLDLEVAREQVTVTRARNEEGRASVRELEEARLAESEKWTAYHLAQNTLERVRLQILKLSGNLVAALR